MKIVYYIILIVVFFYVLLCLFLFLKQKSLVYFPDKTDFSNCKNFSKNEVKNFNGTKFYEKIGKTNNVVIFFHGNIGRACDRTWILNTLKKTNHNIIFLEYDSYADNKKPSIKDILKNVDDVGNYIKTRNFNKIYVIGRSLGTGPASYFAGKFRTDKLFLISPYNKLSNVAQSKYPFIPVKLLFTENFDSETYLKNYKNDIFIVHGKQDKVIPYKFGLKLYNNLTTNSKDFFTFENKQHNNIYGKQLEDLILKYFN